MHFVIHTQALGEAMIQRLRIASNLLGAFNIKVTLDHWKGSGCDLLVACQEDKLANKSARMAREQGIQVLMMCKDKSTCGDQPCLSTLAPVSSIARAIRQTITPRATQRDMDNVDAPGALHTLLDPRWRGKAVDIHYQDHVACLRPREGRVFARSRSELDKLRQVLGEAGSESVTVHAPDTDIEAMASMSLEAFMLVVTSTSSRPLPKLPDVSFRLKAWPDLGSIPQLQEAMNLSSRLIFRHMSLEELIDDDGGNDNLHLVKACLWAFIASGLITMDSRATETDSVDPKPRGIDAPRQEGVWASIARTFGLFR